jgi:hypothetical protein
MRLDCACWRALIKGVAANVALDVTASTIEARTSDFIEFSLGVFAPLPQHSACILWQRAFRLYAPLEPPEQ